MERQIKFKLLGMDTDSDVSILNGTSSLENYNVRFTVTENGQADAAISNERGTKVILSIQIEGVPIGYCTISDFIVIFTTKEESSSTKDRIYIFKQVTDGSSNSSFERYFLYVGDFNFNVESPVDCQAVWDRGDLLKVFWIDGENPLRFLIIPKEKSALINGKTVTANYFNAVKELDFSKDLEASIDVSKLSFGGTFPAGTILYAFTYYSKYGAESNIFKLTPLFYISNSGTGSPADRSTSCSFQIVISDVDKEGQWDYLRVYSILRTAINGQPVCKRVADINISKFGTKDSITYIDNGELGETVDSTRLLYVGGERIVPKTIALKDGTLFLGNYKIVRPEVDKTAKDTLKETLSANKMTFFNTVYTIGAAKYIRKMVPVLETALSLDSTYSYTPQLSDSQNKITTFKSRETYRIGIQLLDKTGRWSEPIFLFDSYNTAAPDTLSIIDTDIKVDPDPDLSEGPIKARDINDEWSSTIQKPAILRPWEDLLIDGGSGSGGNPSTGQIIGGSSGNNTVSTKTVKSAVKALLPFGYINMKLGDLKYKDSNMLAYLKSLGYTRVRPIIVYPNAGNREVLFQGVANPTIKKGPDSSTLDYRIPSWFFRPVESNNSATTGEDAATHYGYNNRYKIGPSFRGVYPVYLNGQKIPYYSYDKLYNNSQAEFQYKTTDGFWIDWSVLTIDSPDIRFDEQLSLNDLEGVKARVVGFVDLAGNSASYSIDIEGSTETIEKFKDKELIDTIPLGNKIKVPLQYLSGNIKSLNFGACLINYPLWMDGVSDKGQGGYDNYFAQWYIFPWHRNGSLNNCSSTNMNNVEGAARPSMLKKKTLANSRFGYNTIYGTTNLNALDVNHARVFIQSSDNLIDRFPDGTLFKNSIDVVLPASGLPSYRALGLAVFDINDLKEMWFYYGEGSSYTESSHTIELEKTAVRADTSNFIHKFFRADLSATSAEMRYYDPHNDNYANNNTYHMGNDPIPMLFKTGSNCVIQLPSPLDYSSLKFALTDNTKTFKEVASGHWLPLVEVYRDVNNKFGGDSEDAIQQNEWLIAGKPVNLDTDIKLFWDYGDTYFQRYDCLKTIPYSDSSVNNIIEILSFFCETRINIDGRYDVNRGLQDNTIITVNNFNQINDVYTLFDNYFQYYTSDEDLSHIDLYQNQIIWSLTRAKGDLVDPWTNVTLLNYLDLDGSRGLIRAIINFNGQLYAFQDTGLSMINYNQNVVLNSENGVPIEIGNSGKVSGSTYLSTSQGCINKQAVADVGQGLIFVDPLNKQFNLFDGKQIVNLGENAKFQSWIRNHCGSSDQWNPLWKNIDANTITFLHDKEANEILLTSKNFSAAYNLGLMKFTSFYSYEGVPWMAKLNSSLFVFGKDLSEASLRWSAWSVRKGRYNEFFNKFQPYYIEFVASDTKYFDYLKLFSTIEVRDTVTAAIQDTYDKEYKDYIPLDSFSFDHINVYDSYQESGTQELEFKRGIQSNLKPKFRTWRIAVPRNANKGVGRVRDRMRDHFMTVNLSHLNESYNSVKVHDIIMSYMI